MDKIKVNNQVVKMRKHVKRAKLFAINKFTKQLKKLQNKKGNDSQAEKNQRKVERLLEKVKILKKMMPDFVSKKALSKAQDWNALLTQKNLPLEDQCLALLANDSEVQKEVEKFHAQECQLVEKIPSLLLEWEMKSKMPKTPEKNKKASDIKKQKLDKITKRKKSNFKGATFPNNVAVDKSFKAPGDDSRKLPHNSKVKDTDECNKKQSKIPELGNENDVLDSESLNNSSDSESGDFFTKAAESNKNQSEIPELMDDDSNKKLNSESYSDSTGAESGAILVNATKGKKRFLSKKQVHNKKVCRARSTEDSVSDVNSSDAEDGKDLSIDKLKDSFSAKIESDKDSSADSRPSIFERLNAFANTDTKKLKTKNSKSSSQNTKAIKVLNLNELQDSEQILIQGIPDDSPEPSSPQTVVPKKDSFFLNGDKEMESSGEDENNTNNYKGFKPRRKFPNFDRNERDGRFKRNNFGDKSRANTFKGKDFNRNENRFQNKRGKGFSHGENKFQKNVKGNFQLNDRKRFGDKSKGNLHPLKSTHPANGNDSKQLRRENKRSTMNDSSQSKKQPNEQGETNVHLHPSWEAKNKLKEAAKSGFKGKRIVFD